MDVQERIPQEGGALLVPNHVSFIDGFLLLATTDRPIRFLVDQAYYEHPWLNPLAKIMGAIPISSHGSTREILQALREAGRRLDDGELVCIFPEGQITRTGNLLPSIRYRPWDMTAWAICITRLIAWRKRQTHYL